MYLNSFFFNIYIKGRMWDVCLYGKHILHSIVKICNSNDYNIVIDTIIM